MLTIPGLSLVLLIGASGAGKSTFARRHFRPTEVVSSDACRALVSDDENDLDATGDAFDLLHTIVAKRLARGRLTVVDATNVQREARRPLIELAREYHVLPVAVVFDVPERLCLDRNRARMDRTIPEHAIRRQHRQLREGLRGLEREGLRMVHLLRTAEEVDAAELERQRLWVDRRDEFGPFDVVGDVHGCFDELRALLDRLGYAVVERPDPDGGIGYAVTPPPGRRLILLGDLVDRGPRTPDVLRLAMGMVEAGTAFCVPGNHDDKLRRALQGRKVRIAYGLAESLAQIGQEPAGFELRAVSFLDGLVSHLVLAGGDLVVAHAGMKEPLQGRASGVVREFALYGETTGETDEFGLPVRFPWAAEYRGRATVLYGHTPVPEPEWVNNTLNLDTGCVFGGRLTALRYPERELVAVTAARVYAEPARPFLPAPAIEAPVDDRTAQQGADDVLDLGDVSGKRSIATALLPNVTIRAENAAAALEVMARFAVDPRWLIYLPPTMSPVETSRRPGLLEHPAEAFDYYRRQGVDRVVCEEKHMGSRAVVLVCRDAESARRRFGVVDDRAGIVYTRTGRAFFDDERLEHELLDRLRQAIGAAGLWHELATDWVCLDAEVMPWSLKAQGLLRHQYAPVGTAGRAALAEAERVVAGAMVRDPELAPLRAEIVDRRDRLDRFGAVYRRYRWPVAAVDDLRLAPFHLLASEGGSHADKEHRWHMTTLARLAESGPPLFATDWREIDLADPAAEQGCVEWWEGLTNGGGEGMVVKPASFVARGRKGIVQPALKVRGREYLRLVYGPEYDRPESMERLRERHVAAKRSLALREFALGLEALDRFGRGEPLRRVHEAVFGVLALESEPVDPRL